MSTIASMTFRFLALLGFCLLPGGIGATVVNLAFQNLAEELAANDPELATSWLASIPDSEGSSSARAGQSFVTSWAIADPVGLVDYIALLESMDSSREIPSWVTERWQERLNDFDGTGGRRGGRDRPLDPPVEEEENFSYLTICSCWENVGGDVTFSVIPAVPEPTTTILVAFGAFCLLRRRR